MTKRSSVRAQGKSGVSPAKKNPSCSATNVAFPRSNMNMYYIWYYTPYGTTWHANAQGHHTSKTNDTRRPKLQQRRHHKQNKKEKQKIKKKKKRKRKALLGARWMQRHRKKTVVCHLHRNLSIFIGQRPHEITNCHDMIRETNTKKILHVTQAQVFPLHSPAPQLNSKRKRYTLSIQWLPYWNRLVTGGSWQKTPPDNSYYFSAALS